MAATGFLPMGAVGKVPKAVGKVLANAGGNLAKVVEKTAALDFMENTGRLNGQLYGPEKLGQLRSYLERRGITLKVGDEFLPPGYAGGFSAGEKSLVVRSNPTNYEVWHELTHFRQYRSWGE